MLPRKNRLTVEEDFLFVKNKGKRCKSEHFLIQFVVKKNQKESRFGIIVNKDISPHASVRNKTKRALREAIRRSLYCMGETYDVVIVAFPTIAKVYTSDIMNQLMDSFVECGICK